MSAVCLTAKTILHDECQTVKRIIEIFRKIPSDLFFIGSEMAVLSLSIIRIRQVTLIREDTFYLLIVLFILASLPQIFFGMLLFRL